MLAELRLQGGWLPIDSEALVNTHEALESRALTKVRRAANYSRPCLNRGAWPLLGGLTAQRVRPIMRAMASSGEMPRHLEVLWYFRRCCTSRAGSPTISTTHPLELILLASLFANSCRDFTNPLAHLMAGKRKSSAPPKSFR